MKVCRLPAVLCMLAVGGGFKTPASAADATFISYGSIYAYGANFNPSATTTTLSLPDGWSSSLGGIDSLYNTTASIPAGGAAYLFDNASSAGLFDRDYSAVLKDSTGTNNYFTLALNNTTGLSLSQFTVKFSESTVDAFGLSYSFDNANWTNVSSDTVSLGASTNTLYNYTKLLNSFSLASSDTLYLKFDTNNTTAIIDDVAVYATIPEPSTYALLLGVGTLGLVGYRRFRRK